jgi:pyruvate/2-oxoglutarate dehydrogenase complex dihydrolipoamide dehydrogenase (E3) component
MEYDAVIIGVGTGGEGLASSLRGAGMKVAAIEKELVGGLCAYWGCMPSKTLLRPGTIAQEAESEPGTSRPALDFTEIAPYRNWMVRDWNDGKQVEELQQAGIDFFRGDACITGHGQVQVNGTTLQTQRIIISTGSVNSTPPIEGLEEAGYWTNREATAFQTVPRSVIALGGGAVGSELGQVLHSFGAEVTIVEEAKQLLGHESPDAARYLQRRFEQDGIKLHLGRKATEVERGEKGRTVTLDDGTVLTAEVVLVATGRHASVDGLGLERVGVQTTKQGIKIDEHCRAAENVWAVGDVTGVAMFTHVAAYQSRIAAADILGNPRAANYSDIPAVTFTDPEVASVGITDSGKAPQGMEIVQAHADLKQAARTDTYGKGYQGALHLLADKHDKVLVGAWAAGPLAGEWIQWATLAIRARVPVHVLDDTILAFPTFTRLYLDPLEQLQKQLQ